MYRQLQQWRRIQNEFHVTLIHRAMSGQHQDYWNALADMHVKQSTAQNRANGEDGSQSKQQPGIGQCKVVLERIVWDNRIMCFVVRLVPVTGSEIEWKTVNDTPHVTIGTADQSVKPKESNDLLKRWLAGGSGGATGIQEVLIRGHVELTGDAKAVPSRT